MMYSGAELIRNSATQAERIDRIRMHEGLRPVESSAESRSSLDENTQNALFRFARFIKKDGKGSSDGGKAALRKKGLPTAYLQQIQLTHNEPDNDASLDIYI